MKSSDKMEDKARLQVCRAFYIQSVSVPLSLSTGVSVFEAVFEVLGCILLHSAAHADSAMWNLESEKGHDGMTLGINVTACLVWLKDLICWIPYHLQSKFKSLKLT